MYKIYIIGISQSVLSLQQKDLLGRCDIIFASKRFRNVVTHFSAHFQEITPLDKALDSIANALTKGNIAVLASGDPLFFGIGKKILQQFNPQQVEIHPSLSSLQLACTLFKIPWDDAVITSLHGRKNQHIPGLFLKNYKNIILTDKQNSPDTIARLLLEYLERIGEYSLSDTIQIHVATDIGLETERLFHGNLQAAAQTNFSPLNIVCLIVPRKKASVSHVFGLIEDEISHSRGLITKNEVRAVTLHALQLKSDGVLWDIGAGSGSLSIEAARFAPEMTVYAIEHKEEGLQHIKTNILTFGCYNIVPVSGRAPESLASLPAPDCVFIGGSGGYLAEIVGYVAQHLKNDGRLVINGVLSQTIKNGPIIMRENGFSVTSTVVNITRFDEKNKQTTFNPISIMTGKR